MSVEIERKAFRTLVAAEIKAAAAVEDALTSAEFSGASQDLKTLADEIHLLRACIERCKSVQRVNEAAADEWQADADKRLELGSARVRAIVYREIATELAKALEGF